VRSKFLAVLSMPIALACCSRSAPSAEQASQRQPIQVIEAAWNGAVASRIKSLGNKFTYTLPELRIYDAHRALVFRQIGDTPTIDAAVLNRAISADRPIAGPTFADTVADLDTADHHPAAAQLPANKEVTIFDYWADWCVGCKVLGKRLMTWAATQPRGTLRIVKAEADVNKLSGEASPSGGNTVVRKVTRVTTSPDGKVHTVVTRTVKTTTS
jgi:thiol-disulfide isomerase/thioredoxin